MATYYIQRKNTPEMDTFRLNALAVAFRQLYCGPLLTDEKLKIIIHGEWPDMPGGGLWLRHNEGGEVVKIGRKYITIRYRGDMGEYEEEQVELCPTRDTGFTEIMFITVR